MPMGRTRIWEKFTIGGIMRKTGVAGSGQSVPVANVFRKGFAAMKTQVKRGRMHPIVLLLVGCAAGIVLDRLLQRVIDPPVALAPGLPSKPIPEPVARVEPPAPVDILESIPGDGTATAPEGYPIKGNERSGIYHVPGGFAYDRTIATVHFRTEDAAERAGLRHAKA